MIITDPVGDYDPGRPRRWVVHFVNGTGGSPVVVRHYATAGPCEDLTENPPSHELTWDEWATKHAAYGLDVDGTEVGR